MDEAYARGQRSLELARELKMPRKEGHNLRIMGQVVQARQQHEEAERYFRDSHAMLVDAGDEYEAAQAQLALAEY